MADAHATMRRVLIVGCGPTGAAVAAALQPRTVSGTIAALRTLRGDAATDVAVTIWDKARRPGGRMSTYQFPPRGDAPARAARCDLGAQYFTDTAASTVASSVVHELRERGVLTPLEGRIVGQTAAQAAHSNNVACSGTAALVHALLTSSPAANVCFNRRLAELRREGATWVAIDTDSVAASFDAVVLTLPAPQLLQLGGDVPHLLQSSGVSPALVAVAYSSRYALGLMYDATPASSTALLRQMDYVGRYIDRGEDDVIRYVSFDSRKRGVHDGAAEDGLSVVVHSSVSYGAEHVDDDIASVQATLLDRWNKLGGAALPPPSHVKCHRWRYSQVTAAYDPAAPHAVRVHDARGAAYAGAVCISGGSGAEGTSTAGTPPLILAGDSFTVSNLEGCLLSAEAAVTALNRCAV